MALLFEVRDKIATITINRPAALNAMDPETYQQLSEAWIEVRDHADIWVAILTGAGNKAFSAGADLKKTIPRQPEAWEFWQTQAAPILNRGLEVWKPIIAAVNGYCLAGGMTLLMATDIRVAAEHATFGLSEVKRGILPGNGGTQRTMRQLPYAIGMELLLLGDRIDAHTAHRYGLINAVVPAEQLMATAQDYARRLCANAPLAVRAIKELAVRSLSVPLNEGLRLEQAIGHALRQTDDAKEGPRAFAEKRPPHYTGQ